MPKRDVNWRPGSEWAAVVKKLSKKNCYTVIVLAEDKRGGVFLEEAYWLGDRLTLSRPVATFSNPEADGAGWRRFVVVRVHRPAKK